MPITHENDKKFSANADCELDQHLPRSFQTMVKIEELAQERLQQIRMSIERGETTLESVKKERGIL